MGQQVTIKAEMRSVCTQNLQQLANIGIDKPAFYPHYRGLLKFLRDKNRPYVKRYMLGYAMLLQEVNGTISKEEVVLW